MAKAAPKAPTKTEVLKNIAETSGLNKNDVAKMIDALAEEIKKNLSTQGPGVFAIPGLVKIERKIVAAKPEQKHVPNPFKPGEFRDIPAKPASVKIKVRALKNLKDMVN
jgi:nucleoid DNA-binding protein